MEKLSCAAIMSLSDLEKCGSAQTFIQIVVYGFLHGAFQRCQYHTQLDFDVDFIFSDINMPTGAAAFENQAVTFPAVFGR